MIRMSIPKPCGNEKFDVVKALHFFPGWYCDDELTIFSINESKSLQSRDPIVVRTYECSVVNRIDVLTPLLLEPNIISYLEKF